VTVPTRWWADIDPTDLYPGMGLLGMKRRRKPDHELRCLSLFSKESKRHERRDQTPRAEGPQAKSLGDGPTHPDRRKAVPHRSIDAAESLHESGERVAAQSQMNAKEPNRSADRQPALLDEAQGNRSPLHGDKQVLTISSTSSSRRSKLSLR
jgi:hypothetical protein